MNIEQPLPCPFCGEKEIEIVRYGTNKQSCIVCCTNCGCRLESNEIGAFEDWNSRVEINNEE